MTDTEKESARRFREASEILLAASQGKERAVVVSAGGRVAIALPSGVEAEVAWRETLGGFAGVLHTPEGDVKGGFSYFAKKTTKAVRAWVAAQAKK